MGCLGLIWISNGSKKSFSFGFQIAHQIFFIEISK